MAESVSFPSTDAGPVGSSPPCFPCSASPQSCKVRTGGIKPGRHSCTSGTGHRCMESPLGNITHIWSLAVEEHFYLVWPLVIAVIPARHRFKVVGLLTVAFGIWRIGLAGIGSRRKPPLLRDGHERFRPVGWLSHLGRVVPSPIQDVRLHRHRCLPRPWMFGEMTAGLFVAAVPLATIMVYVATTGLPAFEASWIRWLGTISYGAYLWHMLIPPLWMIPGAVVAGWLSWRLIQQPIIEGRRPRRLTPRPVLVGATTDQFWLTTFASRDKFRPPKLSAIAKTPVGSPRMVNSSPSLCSSSCQSTNPAHSSLRGNQLTQLGRQRGA